MVSANGFVFCSKACVVSCMVLVRSIFFSLAGAPGHCETYCRKRDLMSFNTVRQVLVTGMRFRLLTLKLKFCSPQHSHA
eukprot:3377570-Amphidinium_carterae.2